MEYISIDKVESFFRTKFNYVDYPTVDDINDYIAEASALVSEIAGIKFEVQEIEDEVYDVETYTAFILPNKYPVLSVQSVDRNKGTEFDPVWEPVDKFRLTNGFVRMDKQVRGPAAVRLSYTAGFEQVPQAAQELTLALVVEKIMQSEQASETGAENVQIGPLQFSSSVPPGRLRALKEKSMQARRDLGSYKALWR